MFLSVHWQGNGQSNYGTVEYFVLVKGEEEARGEKEKNKKTILFEFRCSYF